jgi:hypothetical protein
MLVTAGHLLLETDTDNVNSSGEGLSILERSDDDGRTWQRADNRLPESAIRGVAQSRDAAGEALITLVPNYSGGIGT